MVRIINIYVYIHVLTLLNNEFHLLHHPNAIQYRIDHNVPNNDNVSVVFAPTTATIITGDTHTVGSNYTIQIQGSNTPGYGPTVVITIGK